MEYLSVVSILNTFLCWFCLRLDSLSQKSSENHSDFSDNVPATISLHSISRRSNKLPTYYTPAYYSHGPLFAMALAMPSELEDTVRLLYVGSF